MLFTYHVTAGTRSYTTQQVADDWEGAKQALITSEGFQQFTQALMPVSASTPLASADIFMMVPMTGLKHCWVMQGGRQGEYFTAIVVRTDETGEAEDLCAHDN